MKSTLLLVTALFSCTPYNSEAEEAQASAAPPIPGSSMVQTAMELSVGNHVLEKELANLKKELAAKAACSKKYAFTVARMQKEKGVPVSVPEGMKLSDIPSRDEYVKEIRGRKNRHSHTAAEIYAIELGLNFNIIAQGVWEASQEDTSLFHACYYGSKFQNSYGVLLKCEYGDCEILLDTDRALPLPGESRDMENVDYIRAYDPEFCEIRLGKKNAKKN